MPANASGSIAPCAPWRRACRRGEELAEGELPASLMFGTSVREPSSWRRRSRSEVERRAWIHVGLPSVSPSARRSSQGASRARARSPSDEVREGDLREAEGLAVAIQIRRFSSMFFTAMTRFVGPSGRRATPPCSGRSCAAPPAIGIACSPARGAEGAVGRGAELARRGGFRGRAPRQAPGDAHLNGTRFSSAWNARRQPSSRGRGPAGSARTAPARRRRCRRTLENRVEDGGRKEPFISFGPLYRRETGPAATSRRVKTANDAAVRHGPPASTNVENVSVIPRRGPACPRRTPAAEGSSEEPLRPVPVRRDAREDRPGHERRHHRAHGGAADRKSTGRSSVTAPTQQRGQPRAPGGERVLPERQDPNAGEVEAAGGARPSRKPVSMGAPQPLHPNATPRSREDERREA